MGTIYQFNQLVNLEFEIDVMDAVASFELIQHKVSNKYLFKISHTELNKLIGKIQAANNHLEFNDLFQKSNLGNESSLLTANLSALEFDSSWITEYQFLNSYQEIRA